MPSETHQDKHLLATEPAGEATLCLVGVVLDGRLDVSNALADLLVEVVDGVGQFLAGFLSVLIDVLLG